MISHIVEINQEMPVKLERMIPSDSSLGLMIAPTHEFDIRHEFEGSKFRILVFKNRQEMIDAWNSSPLIEELGSMGLEADSVAAVRDSFCAGIDFNDGKQEEFRAFDPEYLGVAFFHQGGLGIEIIAHEAGHMAFAHAERFVKPDMIRHDEVKGATFPNGIQECVCYPLGIYASQLFSAFVGITCGGSISKPKTTFIWS